jgi:RND family efflux transporter MFP subunit
MKVFRSRLSVAGLAVVSGLAGCGEASEQAPEAPPDRPVLVSVVRYAAQSQGRDFVATIRARVESDLGFRVAGKVVKRFVQNGQRVKAGDALATLDENDLRLQKEQADAELSAANMALAQASGDEKRALALRKNGWTTQAALDRIRAAAEEARGRRRRAERAVELASNSLDYATLRADADGVVTETLVEPGQVVAAGQTAIRIARMGELEAAVSLPEDYAAAAGKGSASLTLWTNRSKTYRAKLRELSPSADPVTRTFSARYTILDPDPAIALGMTAALAIDAAGDQRVVKLPLSAIYDEGRGPAVWKVAGDGRLQLASVRVLRLEGDAALVAGALAEGDRIVTLGVHKLQAGSKVRAVTRETL